ncbi:MAG: hypothetical protein OEQ39_05655 [Gammaproteobacteria bacterium]|nr:hypothetical protein [Gammaproteobacteria bacterium]
MAIHADSVGDVLDIAHISCEQVQGNLRSARRTLDQIRGRSHKRCTNREAALLKLNAADLRRCAKLLDEAAADVNVVVRR